MKIKSSHDIKTSVPPSVPRPFAKNECSPSVPRVFPFGPHRGSVLACIDCSPTPPPLKGGRGTLNTQPGEQSGEQSGGHV